MSHQPTIDPTASIDPTATVGVGTYIWGLVQVRENASVGSECVISRGAYVGPGVQVGDRCKIKNDALVFEPAVLEDGVFVGPAAVLTNDTYPRAVTPDGLLKTAADWDPVGVTIRTGAAIGARAVCVAPVDIGAWAVVAAGAVVTKDVPEFALMVGVPAHRVGWVGRHGVPLRRRDDGRFECPRSGDLYAEVGDRLVAMHGNSHP